MQRDKEGWRGYGVCVAAVRVQHGHSSHTEVPLQVLTADVCALHQLVLPSIICR